MSNTTINNNLTVNGKIISSSFPGALDTFADGFGRLKMSLPQVLFDSSLRYFQMSYFWENLGTGAFAHDNTNSMLTMTVTSGQRAARQTRQYFPYQPGRTNVCLMTGVLVNATAASVTSRIGSFDGPTDKVPVDNSDRGGDGNFFQLVGTTLSVVQRKTIGSAPYFADTVVNQSSWNVDKLDGTGASGITLDPTKANIFFITREWLGVGRVVMGIFYDGYPIVCHFFRNENTNTGTYMKQASLPIRYEITSTSATAIMTQICSAVISEGGYIPMGVQRAITTSSTSLLTVNTTNTAYLSIRLRAVAIRAQVQIVNVYCYTGGNNPILMTVNLGNITLGGSPSWTAVATESIVEYDTAGTTVTGGEVISTNICSTATKVSEEYNLTVNNVNYLTATASGTSQIMTVSAKTLNATSASTIFGITFIEIV